MPYRTCFFVRRFSFYLPSFPHHHAHSVLDGYFVLKQKTANRVALLAVGYRPHLSDDPTRTCLPNAPLNDPSSSNTTQLQYPTSSHGQLLSIPRTMAGFSSSPPSVRRPSNTRGLPTYAGYDDIDELTDTIPASPYTTQPTQVVGRATLGPRMLDVSSSPIRSSVIEVPASSPFQALSGAARLNNGAYNSKTTELPHKQPTSFASRLAPAGTAFRPPPQQPRGQKRPAVDPIEPILIESSDDDGDNLSPARGQIKPTAFKKRLEAFEYLPVEKLQERTDEVYTAAGGLFPQRICREALQACHNNVNDAVVYLYEAKHLKKNTSVEGKSEHSSFEKKAPAKQAASTAKYQPPLSSPSPVKAKPKPRRRLIQGRRPDRSPSPQFNSPAKAPIVAELEEAPHEHIVIPDGNDGNFEAEDDEIEEAVQVSLQDSTLKHINETSIQELAAMTNQKVEHLQVIDKKRPFSTLQQVQSVTLPRASGSRKSTKIAIGDMLVDKVQEFATAVNAIDNVVAECERRATRVKDEMGSWDIDFRGHRRSAPNSPTSDPLLTPRSLKSYSAPPVPTQPQYLDGHCTMRPFQLFGLNWMNLLYSNGYGCILADEMGLGKTCQVISLIAHLVESYDEGLNKTRPWPNLIVVPPSTLSNWEVEFERFAPGLSVLTYQGSQPVRQEIAAEMLEAPEQYHVVLTSYTQVGKDEDIEALRDLHPNAAIFDEGHKMKNMKTKIYKDLVRIRANWRMLLTGTPVQNNLKEMLALLAFIDPDMFSRSLTQLEYIFGQKVTLRDVNNGAFLYGERISRARNILEPFILQRRKDQVLSDMPKKVCNVAYCDLISSQKDIYNDYERLFKSGPVKTKSNARQNDQNNPWIQLRKAAIHPQLFRRYFADEKVERMAKTLMKKVPQSELQQPQLHHLVGELKNCSDFELHLWCRDYPCIEDFDIPEGSWMESGKVVKMLELIHEYQKNGDRVLVFSKFAKVIEILREVLFTDGVDHCVLYGATNVEDRQHLINEFNNNKNKTVFLLTTGAGGTGINLTSANKVIIFDQSDNPQDDIQAENRAHRLGQTRDVEVIRLLTTHTIEELIYKACSKKIELANKVTGAADMEEMGKDAEATLEKEVRAMMADQLTPS